MQSLQRHGVHVQEIYGEDPGCVGAQELPPGGPRGAAPDRCPRRAGSPRRWMAPQRCRASAARLDPAMAPQRILPRQAQRQSPDTRVAGGRPGLRRPLVSYFFAASLRCQARSVAGVTGSTSGQRRRDRIRASAANQARSAGSYRTARPAGAAPRSHAGASAPRPLLPGRRDIARRSGPSIRQVSTQTTLSSTRPPSHHHVQPVGDSAGQPRNRIFERYRIRLR
jgi:hypothetical protein